MKKHWPETRYYRISTIGYSLTGFKRLEYALLAGKIREVFTGKNTFALVLKDEYALAKRQVEGVRRSLAMMWSQETMGQV